MKLSWGLFFSSLYCTASAASPAVSPETARLIIAQRLGLSRFHSIEHADAEAIRHINAYGGRQQKLFGGDDADQSKAHLLMWIEDESLEDASVIVGDGHGVQAFTISSAPAKVENDRLLEDFIRQAAALPEPSDPKKQTYKAGMEMEHLFPAMLPASHKDKHLQTINEYLKVFRVDKSDNYTPSELAHFRRGMLENLSKPGMVVTVVTLPASSKQTKRTANPWGTYAVPLANGARRENPEAFMSLGSEPSSSPVPPVSDLEDFPVIASQASNYTGPVRGILPSCFNSKSACEKRTHGCSGHGECKLLHKGKGSGKDRQTLDCYGCACVETVEHDGEDKGMETKRKVTYWGGPACQKKDISVQFWLFVLVGVTLAFLVSSAIGMLYSMGSEELPSVIGAGVSGPVRK
ncbi:hypothetical protein HBI88_172650 [Parastagonospora nodorum]|nr:hypothetical protein HBI46_211270 [Parastagonospora nodorum]KAH5761147.1 hypothetical protein HBI97_192590 [Parastagonospora nodorum]KAH5819420.1 hypothetical protein HBI96_052730 [Parastagonospora nodorum]KAH5820711.1 hypothetical protein HBI93_179860 [Parastagonospora nodorum]KAH5836471.1 hypothetical protein HBI94_009940 [Parastagonospora nodorum]